MTTTDFRKFGYRERAISAELLTTVNEHGFPDNFEDSGVTIMMNQSSGCVFFTNDEFQVCMMNGDKLEFFYSCPECGHEGFLEDMPHGEDNNKCKEYLDSIRNT